MLKGARGLNFFSRSPGLTGLYTPAKKIHVIIFITLYVFIKKILNYILKCFANTVYNVPRFEQGQPKNDKSLTRIGFVDIS